MGEEEGRLRGRCWIWGYGGRGSALVLQEGGTREEWRPGPGSWKEEWTGIRK